MIFSTIVLPPDLADVAYHTVVTAVLACIVAVQHLSQLVICHIQLFHIELVAPINVHLSTFYSTFAVGMEGSFAEVFTEHGAFRSFTQVTELSKELILLLLVELDLGAC